jgi:hypothetical protein
MVNEFDHTTRSKIDIHSVKDNTTFRELFQLYR